MFFIKVMAESSILGFINFSFPVEKVGVIIDLELDLCFILYF